MLHLLQEAVNPVLRLRTCVEEWPSISLALREAPRRRTLQIEKLVPEKAILS